MIKHTINIELNSFRLDSPCRGGVKNSLTGITKGFDNKIMDGLDNSGFGFSSSGGDTTPEQTINLVSGQTIIIENKEYTVIEQVEGNKYKVLAETYFLNKKFDDSYPDDNNYATSSIAEYLDREYYTRELKKIIDAIVETSIQQKVFSTGYDGGKNNPTWTGETMNAGTHKVFIPSWDEVTKVYGSDFESLKAYSNGKNIWLRDNYNSDSEVLYVHHNGVLLAISPRYDNGYFRPAFVLDLSKVHFTVK